MTEEQIIKALECCIVYEDCEGCPCAEDNSQYCLKATCKNALDLINRQKAELERLRAPKLLVEKTLSEKELSEMLKKGRIGVIPHIECSIKIIDEDGIKVEEMVGE